MANRAFIVGCVLVLGFVIFGNLGLYYLGQPELAYMAVYSGEGLIESLGATCCLLAAVLFTGASATPRAMSASMAQVRSRILLALALISLAMFGEELSWGTNLVRYYSDGPPTVREFQFADLLQPVATPGNYLMVYWSFGCILWGAVLPIACGLNRSLAQSADSLGIPRPSVSLGLIWLFIAFFGAIGSLVPHWLGFGAGGFEVAFETCFEILLAAWAWEECRTANRESERRWSRTISIAVVSVLVIGFAATAHDAVTRGWPMAKSQQLVEQGRELLEAGKAEESIAYFERAVKVFPNNDSAQHGWGVALMRTDQPRAAIPHLYMAVSLAPMVGRYHHALGQGYIAIREANVLGSALEHIEKALKLLPQNDLEYQQAANERLYIEELRRMAEVVGRNPRFQRILKERTIPAFEPTKSEDHEKKNIAPNSPSPRP